MYVFVEVGCGNIVIFDEITNRIMLSSILFVLLAKTFVLNVNFFILVVTFAVAVAAENVVVQFDCIEACDGPRTDLAQEWHGYCKIANFLSQLIVFYGADVMFCNR